MFLFLFFFSVIFISFIHSLMVVSTLLYMLVPVSLVFICKQGH